MKGTILAVALTIAVATPALAGPPHITIETRPPGTYASFLLARTFHHGTPMPLPLAGTAEGLVNGRRLSVPLQFVQVGETNGYELPQTWGNEGVWVLNIGLATDFHGSAGAVVGSDRSGHSAFVQYPRTPTGYTRRATPGEVDALLSALQAGRQPPTLSSVGFNPFFLRPVATIAAVVLLAVGAVRLLWIGVRRLRAPELLKA